MTDIELFDTGDVRDDAQYWDAFASRVTAQAMKRRATVLQWLAGPRAAVAAVAVVLGALAILLATTEGTETTIRDEWTRLLAPSDPIGHALATGSQPPTVDRLFDDARGLRQ
jgi:hypothetical protein